MKYAQQCTADNGKVGTFGYIGNYPGDYTRVTPVFPSLYSLLEAEKTALETIQRKRSDSKATKTDIRRIMAARVSGDWSAVHASRLYIKHGGEYCELLQYIPMEVNN